MKKKKTEFSFNAVSIPASAALNVFFVLYCLACILPLVLLISVSLSKQTDIINYGYKFFPLEPSFTAYEFLLKDPEMVGRAYAITIGVTVCGVILNVLIGSMYAYAISRPDFKFKRLFTVLVLFTMIFSGGIPAVYYVYVMILHLRNNLVALLLPGLFSGFYVIVMRTFFRQNVPLEVIESSKIDGSSEMRTFFQIVLPISLPILATVGIFSALFYWNDFFDSMLFINKPNLFNLQYTMQQAILNLQFLKNHMALAPSASQAIANMQDVPAESVRMAMVIVGVGPIIIVYPFFQRYFVRGLTVGSVKG